MSPNDGDLRKNEERVRSNLLDFFSNRNYKKKAPIFSVGDSVKLSKIRKNFARGYKENNTDEHFVVTAVDNLLPGENRYRIEDSGGERVTGNFFEDELVRYYPSEFYDITVLGSKGSGKNKKHLIHYVGYPSKFDEYVSSNRLKQIKKN